MRPGVRAINDTGKRFGMLVAVRDVGSKNNQRLWLYRCDCGNEVVRVRSRIARPSLAGQVSNCGCALSRIRATNGRKGRTHGLSSHKLYDVWRQMLRRCDDPSCKDFPFYGGRGIKVCDEWRDVTEFVKWALASGYRENVTIERSDNDGNYEPGNCTWIPNKCQALNTRRLTQITYGPITAHASFWARKTGMSVRTILARKRYGWDDKRTIETPVRGAK